MDNPDLLAIPVTRARRVPLVQSDPMEIPATRAPLVPPAPLVPLETHSRDQLSFIVVRMTASTSIRYRGYVRAEMKTKYLMY